MKNIIVGQSGGPTAVINSSVVGVYEAAKKAVEHMDICLTKIYDKVVNELGGILLIIALISYHIKEIYSSNEIDEKSTHRIFRLVQKEGNREVGLLLSCYR